MSDSFQPKNLRQLQEISHKNYHLQSQNFKKFMKLLREMKLTPIAETLRELRKNQFQEKAYIV